MMSDVKKMEFHLYVLHNGQQLGEANYIDSPTIMMDATAEIKKSFRANVILPDNTDIMNDAIEVDITINGNIFKMGEYYIGTATETTNSYGLTTVEIEGYDGCYKPSRYRTENIYHISAGEKYTQVVQSMLIESGVEKILVTDSPYTIKNDREDWEIGTSYLEIINDLLSEINYDSLWFDNEGYARIAPKRTAVSDSVDHVYKSGKYSVISENRTKETDVFSKYNVFIAYVDNADNESLMIAKAENNDASSILSIPRRGRIQAPPKRLDNIASQEELQAYVDNWRSQSMTSTESLTIQTELDGIHNVLDTVQCEDNLYLESAWEMNLDAGSLMSHTLQREVFI